MFVDQQYLCYPGACYKCRASDLPHTDRIRVSGGEAHTFVF